MMKMKKTNECENEDDKLVTIALMKSTSWRHGHGGVTQMTVIICHTIIIQNIKTENRIRSTKLV